MHDPRSTLLEHNSGDWSGCFIRLNAGGLEQERCPTLLKVEDVDGVIQTCLTYENSGETRTMNISGLPFTMQVNALGGWSLGPSSITPWTWVGELCVVRGLQRRRVIVRHGIRGLDGVVYVQERRGEHPEEVPLPRPLQCASHPINDLTIWTPEPGVELLLDTRVRQSGDATACGLRWHHPGGETHQIVRRYDAQGQMQPLSEAWP